MKREREGDDKAQRGAAFGAQRNRQGEERKGKGREKGKDYVQRDLEFGRKQKRSERGKERSRERKGEDKENAGLRGAQRSGARKTCRGKK